jgi:hypothetical protein
MAQWKAISVSGLCLYLNAMFTMSPHSGAPRFDKLSVTPRRVALRQAQRDAIPRHRGSNPRQTPRCVSLSLSKAAPRFDKLSVTPRRRPT